MFINSRMEQLMRQAAETFAEGSDPFSSAWFSQHGVTLDECMTLSELISQVLHGFLKSDRQGQAQILLMAVASELGQENISEGIRYVEAKKKLRVALPKG